MFAVFRTGGKQYQAVPGLYFPIEKIPGEVGDRVVFSDVLLHSEAANLDTDSKLQVHAEILEHGKHPKVRIVKFKRRKHHLKQKNHRQNYTKIKILEIK